MIKIHSFESLAALDGDGIRYAVYLVGCPLRCVYCHNPDTWQNAKYEMDEISLAKKIKRYKTYFSTNGGVTFSGGEPLLWAKQINITNEYLKKDGINYVLDTSASVEIDDDVKECLKNANQVILDLKFASDEEYIKYTNKSIKTVLKTLDYLDKINKRTLIRTVIVPNINDTQLKLDEYIKILKNYRCIEKYELLAFHTMGFFKYEKLKIENKLKDVKELDEDKLKVLQEYVDKEWNNGKNR